MLCRVCFEIDRHREQRIAGFDIERIMVEAKRIATELNNNAKLLRCRERIRQAMRNFIHDSEVRSLSQGGIRDVYSRAVVVLEPEGIGLDRFSGLHCDELALCREELQC